MSSYVPLTDAERKKMLQAIGAKSFDDLLLGIPKELRQEKLNLPSGLSEIELRHLLRELAGRNETSQTYLSFLGGGAYDHFIPAAVSHLVSVNRDLAKDPSLVNREPYAKGWMFEIRLSDPQELQSLLGAEQYRQAIGA